MHKEWVNETQRENTECQRMISLTMHREKFVLFLYLSEFQCENINAEEIKWKLINTNLKHNALSL